MIVLESNTRYLINKKKTDVTRQKGYGQVDFSYHSYSRLLD